MQKRIVILGGGESGVGAALLARQKGYDVFLSDAGPIDKGYKDELLEDGRLGPTDYNGFSDNSFNAFTIDCVYRWRFAPGSDIFIVWKNNAEDSSGLQEEIQYSYRNGVRRLGDFPQNNSLSVRFIYFLDYLNFARR